jgi:hypothetical protein
VLSGCEKAKAAKRRDSSERGVYNFLVI